MRYLLFTLLLLVGCKDATQPAAATSIAQARQRMDQALSDLAWAHRDCWALGCRDLVGSVQLDTAYAPTYIRLPRK